MFVIDFLFRLIYRHYFVTDIFVCRFVYCEKCFNDIKTEEVEVQDEPTQPATRIRKPEFVKAKNNEFEPEPFVECQECGRKLHTVCVLHMDSIWPNGFTCDNCHKANNTKRKDNKYTAKSEYR